MVWREKANFFNQIDFLGHIRKPDSSLQREPNNGFVRVFGGKVVPNELEEYLKQGVEDSLVRDTNGQYSAPSDFRIGISAVDYENLPVSEPSLPNQLTDRMMYCCHNSDWGFAGSINVRLQAVESLYTGQLKMASTFTEGTVSTSEFVPFDDSVKDADSANTDVAPSQSDDEPQTAETSAAFHPQSETEQFLTASRLIPAVDLEAATELSSAAMGEDPPQEETVTLPLQDGSLRILEVCHGSNTVGRDTASGFRLPDIGISHQHVEVTWGGQDAALVDLRSTNGTIVNGEPIDSWLLADGDEISLGHSVLEVQIR